MKRFTIGSGTSLLALTRIIAKWMSSVGANPKNAQKLLNKVSRAYGAGSFVINRGNLYHRRNDQWNLVVHRDDVQNYAAGVEVALKVIPSTKTTTVVTEIPDNPEDGVYAYKEVKGKFHCLFCKVTRKTEKGIQSHVEGKHADKL